MPAHARRFAWWTRLSGVVLTLASCNTLLEIDEQPRRSDAASGGSGGGGSSNSTGGLSGQGGEAGQSDPSSHGGETGEGGHPGNAGHAGDEGRAGAGGEAGAGMPTHVCGDSVVTAGFETCDDGELIPGDGCSANCQLEAVSIAAGLAHTCAVLGDGSVKCWGANDWGQLGVGHTEALGDEAGEMGDHLEAVDLGMDRKAKRVYAGTWHSCALLEDDSVKCWGDNRYGQLGLGNRLGRGDENGEMGEALPALDFGQGRTVKQFASGISTHSCVVLDNDTLKCWGHGEYGGQLGQGNTLSLGDDGGEMGDALLPVNLGTGRIVTSAGVGTPYYTCALLDNLTLKCWGHNYYAQLGLGDRNYRGDGPGEMGDNLLAVDLGSQHHAVQVALGEFRSCALLDDGSVKCWGYDDFVGEFGGLRGDMPGDMGDNLPPVDFGVGRSAKFLTSTRLCALLDDETVDCLEDTLPPFTFGPGRSVEQLSAGQEHLCALLDNGVLKCWGNGGSGRLGLGNTDPHSETTDLESLPAVVIAGPLD